MAWQGYSDSIVQWGAGRPGQSPVEGYLRAGNVECLQALNVLMLFGLHHEVLKANTRCTQHLTPPTSREGDFHDVPDLGSRKSPEVVTGNEDEGRVWEGDGLVAESADAAREPLEASG